MPTGSAVGYRASVTGYVFVSYSHEDYEYVARLCGYLRSVGIEPWTDLGVQHGDRWAQTIEERLRSCLAFVPVMSTHARQSDWVRREILLAQNLEKPILPLLLSGDRFLELLDIQDNDVSGGALPGPAFLARLRSLADGQMPDQARVGEPAVASVAPGSLPTVGAPTLAEVTLDGLLGAMSFNSVWVTIVKRGAGPAMKGERRVHISQIAGINFKEATTMHHGYIQVVVHGETPSKAARLGMSAGRPPMDDPLSTSFSKKNNAEAILLRQAIEEASAA